MMKSFKGRDLFADRVSHKAKGEGEEIRFGLGRSSLGLVLVAASDRGIVLISIRDKLDPLIEGLQEEFPLAHLARENGTLDDFVPGVVEFIERPVGVFKLPLDMRGTEFQKSVWRAVQRIPVSETRNYGEIAAAIGAPKAIRAVGSACTKCKFAMVVPCHRVASKGESTGRDNYGSERRRMLVAREAGMNEEGRAVKTKRKPKKAGG